MSEFLDLYSTLYKEVFQDEHYYLNFARCSVEYLYLSVIMISNQRERRDA